MAQPATKKQLAEWSARNHQAFGGLLTANSFAPVTGDIQSGLLAANDLKNGNYGDAALNGIGLLPFVPSMAGMFIGKGSKVWDALKAEEAQKLAAKGVDPREIWSKTGTFQGVDGHWRQEIPDNEMSQAVSLTNWVNKNSKGKYNAPNVSAAWDYAASQLTPQAPVRAKRLFKHDQLAKAYPYGFTGSLDNQSIMDVPVQISQGGSQGSWGDGVLALHESLLPQPAKSTALHELQHAIQGKEGWARGGSSDTADIMRREVSERIELAEEGLSNENPQELRKLYGDLNNGEVYKRLAGEAEARATQARMNMTMPERLKVFPFDSYDVPKDHLIIRGLLGQ